MNPIEAQQICSSCVEAIQHGGGFLSSVPGLIKRIIKEELWRERKVMTGKIVKLNCLAELITLPPLDGWGQDIKKVEALLKDDPVVLPMWREALTPGKHKHHDTDNISIKHGTSRAYTLSRLKKQFPALYQDVVNGKKSAHRAAIEAGIVKMPTILDQLKKLWMKATKKEQEKFLEAINKGEL